MILSKNLELSDWVVIIFYFLFIASLGWVFKKFNSGPRDYFAGSYKMSWWLLGASAFISNFSSWTFTGAASIAYSWGVVILAYYFIDAIGFLFTVIWFAPLFRQMRLLTAMDAVRQRFGSFYEQFYNWFNIVAQFIVSSVGLVGLSIVISCIFNLPQVPVILTTGLTVLVLALMGGSWAVFAGDFIQLVLLASVTLVAAILTVIAVGGPTAFVRQIPPSNINPFLPAGEKYDWIWMLSLVAVSIYSKNSMLFASKFIVAKDGTNARLGALIPFIGYLVFPIFWFIPPLAAKTIVPSLMEQYSGFHNPEEASYIAVCLRILPHGMIGLMTTGLFAATMASMDVALNKNAGFVINNFYKPMLRPNAPDKELLLAGKLATLLGGSLVITLAITLATDHTVSLFDVYLFISGYLTIPLGTPLFLGIFIKHTPQWAPLATIITGFMVSWFIFQGISTEVVKQFMERHLYNSTCYYILNHRFAINNLVNLTLTSLVFCASTLFYKSVDNVQKRDNDAFFLKMNTPVDFNLEVGGDNSAEQARVLGKLALLYGSFLAVASLIPNTVLGHLAMVFCAFVMCGVGFGLYLYSQKNPKS